jgi:MGT family glycosyltransferase
MARFAFVTWDGGGNVTPAVGIAQELSERGHDVIFIGYAVQRDSFTRRGMRFMTLGESGLFDIYATADPVERIKTLMAHVWASPAHVREVPEAASATSADVLVVDCLMQCAIAAATKATTPWAVLVHSSVAGLIPPPSAPMGAARLAATNGLRAAAGMPALACLDDAWTGQAAIVTTIPSLDPAAQGAGPAVHYVGPVFERLPAEPWESPWEPGDDRPLVVVSFTTTRLWDQSGRIRNTLDALAGDPVRVLVSAAQPLDLGPVPANAAIRAFVPHRQVLRHAAVTVTHGGHGTVAASMADGVPVIALPNPAADQPFLAARIQGLGAGLALDGEAGPEAIGTAVRQVLHDSSFAEAAGRLSAEIRDSSGAAGAAQVLEGLAKTHG